MFMRKHVVLLMLFTMASCATKKEIIYFQDVDTMNEQSTPIFEPIIEANDVLYISISSASEAAVAPFKRNTSIQNFTNNINPVLQGYLVNSKGTIRFPMLGDISVLGKTRSMIEEDLKNKLLDFIKDVVVDVRIMNFKITVLGGVNNPGVFTIADERVTLPEALALAGDLSEDGKRESIMLIREVNGEQKTIRIDITQSTFFESPYYFLKQNDVLYVEPSLKGVKKSGFIPDIPSLLSLFTVILSSVIILTR